MNAPGDADHLEVIPSNPGLRFTSLHVINEPSLVNTSSLVRAVEALEVEVDGIHDSGLTSTVGLGVRPSADSWTFKSPRSEGAYGMLGDHESCVDALETSASSTSTDLTQLR